MIFYIFTFWKENIFRFVLIFVRFDSDKRCVYWKSTKTTLGFFQTFSNCPCQNGLGIPFFNLQCSFDGSYTSTSQGKINFIFLNFVSGVWNNALKFLCSFVRKTTEKTLTLQSDEPEKNRPSVLHQSCIQKQWCMRSARVHVGGAGLQDNTEILLIQAKSGWRRDQSEEHHHAGYKPI